MAPAKKMTAAPELRVFSNVFVCGIAFTRNASRRSERGDLLEFFHDKINATRDGKRFRKLPMSAIAVKLSLLSVRDLYYLKSTCLDAERRGVPFSAAFWSAIRPRSADLPVPKAKGSH
jgi:hypothetical protein